MESTSPVQNAGELVEEKLSKFLDFVLEGIVLKGDLAKALEAEIATRGKVEGFKIFRDYVMEKLREVSPLIIVGMEKKKGYTYEKILALDVKINKKEDWMKVLTDCQALLYEATLASTGEAKKMEDSFVLKPTVSEDAFYATIFRYYQFFAYMYLDPTKAK